ncbi:50S ribosomal protein L15, partial [Candidatus Uhrbacteria bacterium]|nr:50S ribosomal protein L15 [Candidatus Uhrbacteria bacterium]
MSYGLHNLRPARGSRKSFRRYGRGHGSGRGKTAGRGTKGQKARTGGRKGLKRLGMKRILLAAPKLRGFRSLHPKPVVVNLEDLDRAFTAGGMVTPRAIVEAGLVRDVRNGVKVLGGGTVTKALTFKGLMISAPAKAKIEAA